MDEESAAGSWLVAADDLISRLGDPGLRIVDARFELGVPLIGREMYRAEHVPGAVHLDLDADLSAPPARGKGRHPLPDMPAFARKLGSLGIDEHSEVVVYDQTGTMYAARAWWLLRYAGHQAPVRFLDGGFAAYRKAGGPTTAEVPRLPPTTYRLRLREELTVSAADVRSRLGRPGVVLLDARAPERYRGEVEPLDDEAGHIPTALNRPFTDSSSDAGGLLPPSRLAELHGVEELASADEVIAYCGSGVSAAHLALALSEAGLKGVKLYPGSWSEWSSLPGMPVATGAEPGEPPA